MMKVALVFAALAALCCSVHCKISAPKVVVYSRDPGQFGQANTFICHVSNFHPPDINIELLKNGEVLPDSTQTDLAFKQDWHFHLTKSAPFTPAQGDKVLCRVTHIGSSKEYTWDSNM
ncbi:beta-2-microglobulin [Nematolebias whitei]|uniref:beta-2-microglobulin n=1 Tax=Nematolebias whitei TaxID=451745 RepID=UPI00189B8CEF|nr:beta-2-microglobulin [Nematolebias whitei]